MLLLLLCSGLCIVWLVLVLEATAPEGALFPFDVAESATTQAHDLGGGVDSRLPAAAAAAAVLSPTG
jgi:hypothetical protein